MDASATAPHALIRVIPHVLFLCFAVKYLRARNPRAPSASNRRMYSCSIKTVLKMVLETEEGYLYVESDAMM